MVYARIYKMGIKEYKGLIKFKDKEDLELYLFRALDLDLNNEDIDKECSELFGSYNDYEIVKAIEEIDNRLLFVSDENNLIYDKIGKFNFLKIGDKGIYYRGDIIKIDIELEKIEQLNQLFLDKNYDNLDLDLLIENNTIINDEFIKKVIETAEKEKEAEVEAELKREEEKRRILEENKVDKELDFIESGIFEDKHSGIKIDGNKIEFKDNRDDENGEFIIKIEIGKEFRKLFQLKEIREIIENNSYYYNTAQIKYDVRNFLIQKKTNFSYNEKVNGNYVEIFSITFDNNQTKFNGVKVNSSKLKFIINRLEFACRRNTTKNYFRDNDLIEKLNSLSGMKVDLLDLKEIRLDSSLEKNIPIEINLGVDNETFEVNCLNETFEVNWEKCKKYFFCDGKYRSVYANFNFKGLLDFMNISWEDRQKIFDRLKRLEMIQALN